ncbi:g286 [Coccomyxa viridis]|uniref:4-hydroxyphenylpyruvate dioxygenase n=1 Tax=Coccomyxa viridis TaxID=1274662 RepID=A0ABP1FGZ3_9CHLO
MVAIDAAKVAVQAGFKRTNPKTDLFKVLKFHHIDWWCADATSTQKRFGWGLGMQYVAKSDLSTGNTTFASHVLKSHDLVFAFTAPYSQRIEKTKESKVPCPWYRPEDGLKFIEAHGLGVRAVGVLVEDAAEAHRQATAHGARSALEPQTLRDEASSTEQVVAEVELYGDVVLRFVSGSFQGPFLAGYTPVESPPLSYGIKRLDHAVGNVPKLRETLKYIAEATGFHEFAEFTAEDVGTVDSGLNSTVLASNNEMVILPVNEPTFGTKRKSQIQTFLEQNEGPGLQHLALKTDDIFHTLRELRRRSDAGGFDFMPPASDAYYRNLPEKIGDVLTPEQYKEVKELGILVDKDDQGVLLQIFTKPLSDRPTVFVEIIQRIGCMYESDAAERSQPEPVLEQAGGCGGFGKGNFSELFKSIEDYERTLDIN